MTFCPACLTELPDDARFCGVCGFIQPPRGGKAQRFELPQVLSPDEAGPGAGLAELPEVAGATGEPDRIDEMDEMDVATKPRHDAPSDDDVAWATTERGRVPEHRKDEPPRRLRRFTLRGEATVSGEQLLIDGAVENISTGGLFVLAEALPEVGTELEVRFRLPVDETLHRVRGVVAWLRPADRRLGHAAGFGLRFVDLQPLVEAAILVFIQRRDPRCFDGE